MAVTVGPPALLTSYLKELQLVAAAHRADDSVNGPHPPEKVGFRNRCELRRLVLLLPDRPPFLFVVLWMMHTASPAPPHESPPTEVLSRNLNVSLLPLASVDAPAEPILQ